MSANRSRRASMMQSGIRARAELAAESRPLTVPDSEAELVRMLHELSVQEIELEIQADELCRTEEALKAARDRCRDLFDNAPVGYLTLNDRGIIVEANECARSMLGLSASAVEGRPLAAFAAGTDAALLHAHFRAVTGGKVAACELSLNTADGGTVDVRLDSSPATSKGVAFRTALVDITRRKRAEKDLLARAAALAAAETQLNLERERAERAEKALRETLVPAPVHPTLSSSGQRDLARVREEERTRRMEAVGILASGIAHEFTNVLTGIVGYADAAILKLNGAHPAVGLIQQARSAALKAATSAQCFLSFARKTPSRRRAVDLNALVSRMEPLLRALLDGDIELRLSLEAGSVVFCHPDAMEGLVLSLAIDAKRSMPHGGTLTVSTRLTNVSEPVAKSLGLLPGKHVELELADTGAGFDEDARARPFGPFFLGDADEEALGISSVRSTVREQGGGLRVDNHPGHGSTVVLFFPRCLDIPTMPLGSDDVPDPAAPIGGATVLVVEDDDLVRAATLKYLENNGYRVLEARNEREVEHLLHKYGERIDIVLADAVLPGKPASEVFARVADTHSEARVLYMSGHSGTELVDSGRIPSDAVPIRKPFTEERLVSRLRATLASEPVDRDAPSAEVRIVVLTPNGTADGFRRLLSGMTSNVVTTDDGDAVLSRSAELPSLDLLIADATLIDMPVDAFVRRLRAIHPRAALLVLVASASEVTPVVKEPGTACLVSPVDEGRVMAMVRSLLAGARAF